MVAHAGVVAGWEAQLIMLAVIAIVVIVAGAYFLSRP